MRRDARRFNSRLRIALPRRQDHIRPMDSKQTAGLITGIAVGIPVGLAAGNISLGIGVGMAMAIAMGLALK
jgi:hypothetical protein